MSRGPGRLQTAILQILTNSQPPPPVEPRPWFEDVPLIERRGPRSTPPPSWGRVPGQEDDELTTEHVCQRLIERGWTCSEHLERQVRRALDRLATTGTVEKNLWVNLPHYPDSRRAFWRLPRTK